ncbi:NAD(P)-dependent oxidoreductase [Pseudonocardia spinosispora]|uniref:NAD(P)-dependent oxidoreductase n=1 Tax=Pseudonocardia spinosispora TaxID=103441 RepID=UPI0004915000|nr:NAD(P)-dependent oxidoreductase [Pseudonocardia spinosispora]
MKLLYPSNVEGTPDVPDDVTVVRYDPLAPIPAEHHDAEVLVSWGSTVDRMRTAAGQLRALRWVQSLAAGPDVEVAAGFAEDVVITSGRSLHDDTVAEHALALVLGGLRGLHLLVASQPRHEWRSDLGGPRVEGVDGRVETLHGAQVLIWGFGAIAQALAPLLTALGARVTGVARSAGERGGYPVIAEAQLPTVLPDTDVLVMILPHSEQNVGALNAERLALLPTRAWLVNVGRGTTVDEDALLEALREDRIAGAGLDVFRTEPLPKDSPFWDLPNVIISPHSAGGRPRDAALLVAENLAALRHGQALRNVVARD